MKLQRDTKLGFPDLLNWSTLLRDDTVLNKDGSLMRAFYYQGSDLSTASAGELNHVSATLNAALNQFGSGWLLHTDAIRLPARDYPDLSESFFPDPVSRMIENERREQFTGHDFFVTGYVMTLTWLPPKMVQHKLVEALVYEGGAGRKSSVLTEAEVTFDEACHAFLRHIDGVLDVLVLEGSELLTMLHRSLSGEYHPINMPAQETGYLSHLDSLLGSYELRKGDNPLLGRQFIQTVSVSGFPAESWPQLLESMAGLNFPYRWSSRWLFLDSEQAQSALKGMRRLWGQQVRGVVSQLFRKGQGGTVNMDALGMVDGTDQALADASSGLVSFGYYTPVFVVMHEDAAVARKRAETLEQRLKKQGFSAHIETLNTLEAFLGSLPGHGVQNVRRPLIHSFNLAHLLPLSAVWAGDEFAPCPFYPPAAPPLLMAATGSSTPFRFNLHVGDVGHTLMIGPTGAGKSMALAFMAAQFLRYKGATVFAFDKGNSLLPLTLGVGGQHYAITGSGDEQELSFAPLANLHQRDWFGVIEDWCSGLLEIQLNQPLAPAQRGELHRALVELASGKAERTMTNLRVALQDATLKEALTAYTVGGECGYLLDGNADSAGLRLSRWNVFEIEELMGRHERVRLPVLLYLFKVIEKSLKGQPTLLILDEAWLMLGHPVFKEKIREWLKVLRKANCAVVVATQSLSDAQQSGILDVLAESTATKIFLANADAPSEMNAPVYHSLGISSAELTAISQMAPKRQYFIKSAIGKRVVDFNLGPIALAFSGKSDKESLAKIKQLWDNEKDGFYVDWFNYLGVKYERF